MSEPLLLPEQAGCPNCGSTTGKRWRSYSGVDICTDCDWDYLSTLNGRKLLDARSALPPLVPRRSPRFIQQSQQRLRELRFDQREREADMQGRAKVNWKKQLEEIITPSYNSVCLLCGHIFWGAAMSSCSRCGGLCQTRSDHDLGLMTRHATELVEAER